MLKIKDDVDLKGLYKYDFNKYKYYSGNGDYYSRNRIHIDERTRIIEIPTEKERYNVEDYIHDLIKADLVEKV